jgi:hypothetical protein
MKKIMLAPCGMNCAVCSKYLALANGLKMSQCSGCRPGNKHCSYLFEKCGGVNANRPGTTDAPFCFECELYPCKEIKRMDTRYRKNYRMSTIENLETIRESGLESLIRIQIEKYSCDRCDQLISTHNNKCFQCDTITKLIEKDHP